MTTTTASSGTATTWTIDPAHTQVGFEVKHMMFAKVRGRFTDVEGTLRIGPTFEDSTASVTIRSRSIDTGQAQRDAHLRSADFFDVERFPELTFNGVSRRNFDGTLVLAGELMIREVVRRVELEVEESGRGTDPWGNERIGFTATATIDRRDYGLTWNQALETGGILVGNDIKIVIEVQAVPAES
ncbi:MAG: YceI family protein [Gemmatimonadetes bacterium]|nr:YceI family protein [Gemmatimonadota bacterium]